MVSGGSQPRQDGEPDAARLGAVRWTRRPGGKLAVAALAIALVTLAIYAPVVHFGPVWDDVDVVTANPYLKSWAGLRRILSTDTWSATNLEERGQFYRPIGMVSFFMNRLALGNSPGAYHGVNAALHAVNAVLLAIVARAFGARSMAAWLSAALFFVVLPVNVEPVAYISARFDLLGVAFVLASLVAYARVEGRGGVLGALACFVCAMFTKESFVVVVVLFFMTDVLVLRRNLRRAFGMMLACGVVLAGVLAVRHNLGILSVGAFVGTPVVVLVQSFATLLATYVPLAFFPTNLDPFRPYEPLGWPETTLVVVLATALVAFAVTLALRPGSPPHRRLAAFGLVWIAVAFVPVSVTGPNLLILGDRYAYFPVAGLALVVAAAVQAWEVARSHWRATGGRAVWATATGVGSAVVALGAGAAWGCIAHVRVGVWQDERSLYAAVLAGNPQSPYGLYAEGFREAMAGRFDRAEPLLKASFGVEPRSWRTLNALCFVHIQQREFDQAAGECRQSAALNGDNPRVWTNLAASYVGLGRWKAAGGAAVKAIARKPKAAEPHYLLAVSLANQGDITGSAQELANALTLDPHHEGAQSLRRQFDDKGIR